MELPLSPAREPVTPPPALRPSAACPRCRTELSQVTQRVRREGRLTAVMCPSVTCGYKLILPT